MQAIIGSTQNPEPLADGEQTTADVCFPVHMRRPGQKGFTAGETLSLSGEAILVEPEELLPVGTEIEIEFVVGHELPIARATVASHESEGMRLRFESLPPAIQELIGRLQRDQYAFGDYAIEALVGTGGMAEVYRALAKRGVAKGRTVAVKRLSASRAKDPAIRDLFINEADLSRMLQHPGIVEVFETSMVKDTYFIAMEYVEGGSVADLIVACRKHRVHLPIDFCCYVAGLVANALEYTHTYRGPSGELAEIVHCDVTPGNILITADGRIKLTDFGVAHIGAFGSTEGIIIGKAPYRPPEQFLGGKLSPESDIFALSAVLYEMLTNRRPFNGNSVDEIHKKIRTYRVLPPEKLRPGIPSALSRLIMYGLSPDRQRDRLGLFTRLWRGTFGRRLPKRVPNAAEFGARVRLFSEPLYAAPEVVRVVVNKLRELQHFRPLFSPLESPHDGPEDP